MILEHENVSHPPHTVASMSVHSSQATVGSPLLTQLFDLPPAGLPKRTLQDGDNRKDSLIQRLNGLTSRLLDESRLDDPVVYAMHEKLNALEGLMDRSLEVHDDSLNIAGTHSGGLRASTRPGESPRDSCNPSEMHKTTTPETRALLRRVSQVVQSLRDRHLELQVHRSLPYSTS